ncbi:MAG: FimB [uncultured bacterium]|nr:MAG: FimB [uncultured bacterium]
MFIVGFEMRISRFKSALMAAGVHCSASLVVAALAAWMVFSLWYPYPYFEISGGKGLFFLVILVDVVCGPLLTLVIFNPVKPRRELIIDLAVIGLLQLIALGYGLWAVFSARPVHLVFEFHRIAVVNAADVDALALAQAPPTLQVLPLKGPTLLSLRSFKDGKEQYESTMLALGGIPQAAQPMLWQPWEAAHAQILKESRPVADLKQRFGEQISSINNAIAATGRPGEDLRYLPLMARKEGWTVLIDAQTIKPVGFIRLDSF